MVRFPLSFILFWGYSLLVSGQIQEKYWVYFTDKDGCSLDPYQYFDRKAIERRQKCGIPLVEFTDLPVRTDYLEVIRQHVDSLLGASRWLNAAWVLATEQQAVGLNSMPGVLRVVPSGSQAYMAGWKEAAPPDFDIPLARGQTQRLQVDSFRNRGLDGSHVRIAVFDIGFPGVDKHPAFAHIREEGRILKTWNFITGKENVYRGVGHGRMVLSCIAGMADSLPLGLAPKAEFLLAVTERMISENASEEDNWILAAEWADKNGADIISSSLGYTYERYFQKEMDGHTAPISRAANLAAHKGILIVQAAGNENGNRWGTIIAPADADSVLTVAGTNPWTDYAINFSSHGPAANGHPKPNVAAYGTVVAAGPLNKYLSVSGTSFSTPLIAGFAACVMQLHPDWTNMQVFHAIEKAGHLYPYYDYAHGYGIPQAGKILHPGLPKPAPTFTIKSDVDSLYILPSDSVFTKPGPKNLYLAVYNSDHFVKRYMAIRLEETGQVSLSRWDFTSLEGASYLQIHLEGYTEKINLKDIPWREEP